MRRESWPRSIYFSKYVDVKQTPYDNPKESGINLSKSIRICFPDGQLIWPIVNFKGEKET